MIPNAQESQDFWSEIWGKEEKRNLNADWLKDLKESASYAQQEQVQIAKGKVCAHSKKMANWKAAGPDGVQGYWIKKLTGLPSWIWRRNAWVDDIWKNCFVLERS